MSEAVDKFMEMIADTPCARQRARALYTEMETMGLESDLIDKIEEVILSYYEYGKAVGYHDGIYDGMNK